MEWLEKVFHPETFEKAAGQWQLLILDGHGSHETVDFLTFCFMHCINLLRLPPLTSHLTQPLDVGCFLPLKHYYCEAVRGATREGAPRVTKRMFMDLYHAAGARAFTSSTVHSSWKGASLCLFDSGRVISRANPRPSTPLLQMVTVDGV